MKFIRKLNKYIPFILLCITILSFSVLLKIFIQKQQILILESNKMMSNHSLVIKSMNTFQALQKQLGDTPYWWMHLIEKSDNTILTFSSNDYSKVKLPVTSGKVFGKPKTMEALVGKNISTIKENNAEWIEYNGMKYHVIGEIGYVKDGPIGNYIILNNESIDDNNTGKIFLDSTDSYKLLSFLTYNKEIEPNNAGISRMLDISQITFIFQFFGYAILFFLAWFSGRAYYQIRYQINALKYSLGIRLNKILVADITMLIIVSSIFFIEQCIVQQYIFSNMLTKYYAIDVLIVITPLLSYLFRIYMGKEGDLID